LIVLAACETGVDKYYDGEGMIGASRTFLAAGVPLVVASQWSVDSEATTEIMVRFHKYRKTGGLTTAQALRRAQLDMLDGDNKLYRDPYYWAGFVTFGGYTQF
jgi:CHAT domain-containing protein